MDLPNELIEAWKKKIDNFDLDDMTALYYLAPPEWEVFRNYTLWLYFTTRWLAWGRKERIYWHAKELAELKRSIDSGKLFDLLAQPLVPDQNKSLIRHDTAGEKKLPPHQE